MWKLSLSLLVVAGVELACNQKTTTKWEPDTCSVQSTPEVRDQRGNKVSNFAGCRALYMAGSSSVPAWFNFQLLSPRSSGSFIEPGPGWLSLTIPGDLDGSGTLRLVSTNAVGEGEGYVGFNAADGSLYRGTGSLRVSSYEVSPFGEDDPDSAMSLDVDLSGVQLMGREGTFVGYGELAAGAAPQAASSGGGGGGGCLDNGDSCKTDPTVTSWKSSCGSNPPSQAPCYCAAAATYDCFLRHGCYAEAGANTSVTQAQLESGRSDSISSACALGTCNCL